MVSLLASSLALSGAIVFAPTAGAVPAASCTVTPAANGTFVTISGEGFTAPRNLNDGESTEPLNVDADGNFLLKRFQKNVDYTVLAVNEDQSNIFVNCRMVQPETGTAQPETGTAQPETGTAQPETGTAQPPSTPGMGDRSERAQGRTAGGLAGRDAAEASCSERPMPDRSQNHTDAYWEAWVQAADRAFDRACA
ncbi:hypothetical protein [Streptomyces atratus]|uniref:hypothetical protein n=1 Tax=Streptomyces atratus TaxID=1893 RepID=UPI0018E57034|nr:hypothetical protein [Streptomyces atratus]